VPTCRERQLSGETTNLRQRRLLAGRGLLERTAAVAVTQLAARQFRGVLPKEPIQVLHDVNANSTQSEKRSSRLKEKAIEEFKMFWAIAIYLALMLVAFTSYRRLIPSESGISYLHYGTGVIEALILAKVILIGQALGLGKRFENAPLYVSVLFKAAVFGVLAGLWRDRACDRGTGASRVLG
jgi:hypothetical protein